MAEKIGGVDVSDFGLSAADLANLKRNQSLYSAFGLGSKEDRAAQLEEQKSMTKANILFDLAQAGLIIAATPPTKGESPAATLARAAASSEFFPRVGARSAELQKTKDSLTAQERQMNMAAVQRMQTQRDARIAAEAAAAKEAADRAHEKSMSSIEQGYELAQIKLKLNLGNQLDMTKQRELFDLKGTLATKENELLKEIKELEGAQKDREIERRGVLEQELQVLKGEQAVNLEGIKQINREALERTKNKLSIALEEIKQSGRIELDIQSKNTALELQRQLAEINSALRIEELGVSSSLTIERMVEQSKIDVNKMGIQQGYDLDKMEIAQKYDVANLTAQFDHQTVLQDTKLAVTQKLAALEAEAEKIQNEITNADASAKTALQERKVVVDEDKQALLREQSKLIDLGNGLTANSLEVLGDADLLNKYADGSLDEQSTAMLETIITRYTQPEYSYDAKTGGMKSMSNALSGVVIDAIKNRIANDLNVQATIQGDRNINAIGGGQQEGGQQEGGQQEEPSGSVKESVFNTERIDINELKTPEEFSNATDITIDSLLKASDPKAGVGALSILRSGISDGFTLLSGLVGSDVVVAEKTKAAQRLLDTTNQIMVVELMSSVSGKTSDEQRKNFESIMPKSGGLFSSPKNQAKAAEALVAVIQIELDANEKYMKNTELAKQQAGKDYEINTEKLKILQNFYRNLAKKLKGNTSQTITPGANVTNNNENSNNEVRQNMTDFFPALGG
jgi:hypothetical protein